MAISLILVSTIAGCETRTRSREISRERAIEIAKGQVSFPVRRVEAVTAKSDGRRVWRVTLTGEPPSSQPLLKPILIVEVDRTTGRVVSVARS